MFAEHVRSIKHAVLGVVLVCCIAYFLRTVHQHYAVWDWLVWRYIEYWLASAVWALSCFGYGQLVLRVLRVDLHEDDSFVLAFPLGVFVFHILVFLFGLAQLLRPPAFVLLPLIGVVSGGHELLRQAPKYWRRCRTLSYSALPIVAYGLYGVALLYFQLLSPETFSYDARWYHLPIAQQYAVDGAVKAWPEGWWLAAYPHLSSYLYTWAFLLPASIIFDRYELSAHMEVMIFLATIGSIPALVRRLVPATRARGSWVAIFLFPGLLLYDANLNVGADHVAALFAIPMFISLSRLVKCWRLTDALLFALFTAGAALTKYSAICIVAPPTMLLAIMVVVATFRRQGSLTARGGPLFMFGVVVVSGLLLTSPHWLKNWIWYGDPLYPVLHRYIGGHPWNSEAAAQFSLFTNMLGGLGAGASSVKDALLASLTFSFETRDWPVLHRDLPVFGSLFTLTALCLPLLGATARLWSLCFLCMSSVSIWYWISPRERFLQAALPWMAACTAACLVLLWRQRSIFIRSLTVVMVGIQILWGSDVPFFPTHNQLQQSPFRVVLDFVVSGFQKKQEPLLLYGDIGKLALRLPPDARLLLHNIERSGFGVHVVHDLWQGAINYRELGSPSAIHNMLRGMGVTHAAWYTNKGLDWTPLGHDLAFSDFALNYLTDTSRVGQMSYGRLPTSLRPGAFNDRVAVPCSGQLVAGWYHLIDMTGGIYGQRDVRPPSPYAAVTSLGDAVSQAGFVVAEPRCSDAISLVPHLREYFYEPYTRGSLKFYVRRLGR